MGNNWLPRGYALPSGATAKKILFTENTWELYATSANNSALAVADTLYQKWLSAGLLTDGIFFRISSDGRDVWLFESKASYMISSVQYGPYSKRIMDARAFASTLKQAREKATGASFHDALYIEQYSILLPTFTLSEPQDDQTVLGTWISGGVHISTRSYERLCTLLDWMPSREVAKIVLEAGFPVEANPISARIEKRSERPHDAGTAPQRFALPGRAMLETFFQEHVIDIVQNEEKYARLGIAFPSAIVLHGPPGCGKTFAVEKLIEYLDWPSYQIDTGSIGSAYIHETGKRISEIFGLAIRNAPSVVVIDEMEAFLSERSFGQSSGTHHVEEVAEFLRNIPKAAQNHVLVIAMTNMIDSIDEAILRRGRFDHIIQVDMPSREEAAAALQALLSKLPVAEDVDIQATAGLVAGRPMSDVAFVVKEAGRIAAKNDKAHIDAVSLRIAIDSLPADRSLKRSVGFASTDG